MKNFGLISKPLTSLLRKNVEFISSQKCLEAFSILKKELISDEILKYPDVQKDFNLTVDASNQARSAVFSQGPIGSDLPCSYISRKNYCTTGKELSAAVWAIKQFRHYLYGCRFVLITDHQPLKGLFKTKIVDESFGIFKLLTKVADYEP